MLFDNRIEKKDITYTYEDPRMCDYLNSFLDINKKYHNQIIELKENMDIIRNESVKINKNYQFYANCVYNYFKEITETFSNFSEEVNATYDKFINSYSTLSESESNIFSNMTHILHETMYFNGYLYDLSLKNVNLNEDFLNLNNVITTADMLKCYIEDVNNEDYFNNIRRGRNEDKYNY